MYKAQIALQPMCRALALPVRARFWQRGGNVSP